MNWDFSRQKLNGSDRGLGNAMLSSLIRLKELAGATHAVKTNFQVHNQDAQEIFASKDFRFRAACQVFLTGYRNAVLR